MNPRFVCPSCHFTVYNRRVAQCEKCGQDLPAEFRFSAKERQLLAEEEVRQEKARRDMAHERAEWERRHWMWPGEGG